MTCAECAAAGLTSQVRMSKRIVKGRSDQFWDEAGAFHNHDGDVTLSTMRCTNGHTWTHEGRMPCPACGKPVTPE